MKSLFINEAFDIAVNNYLKSKGKPESILFNSFLVVVIRMLINIYSENDIIIPYELKSEMLLDQNLMKYGASKDRIDNIKRLMDGFLKTEDRNKKSTRKEINVYFIDIQKSLIDLFNLKRISFGCTERESIEFFDLLYTPKTSSVLRLSYNYLNAFDTLEVLNYYNEFLESDRIELNYEIDNSVENNIIKDTHITVDSQNDSTNDGVSMYYLSDKLVNTGNGYVDILVIMSIIITVVMIIVIFTTLVF